MALFTQQPVRIVIAGGGYGGLHAAAGLARRIDGRRCSLTVVQPGLRFVDVCRLHEAAIHPVNISYLLTDALRGFPVNWVDGQVQEVDPGSRTLTVDSYGHPADLPFDMLVIASGSRSNDYGIPGVSEFAVPLKTLDDAERARVLLERITRMGAKGTLAIAGAGLTGVELAAEIADRWKSLTSAKRPGLVLVDAAKRLLPLSGFRETVYARRFLLERGVCLRLETPISRLEPGRIVTGSSTGIAADGVIWCAGVKAEQLPGLETLYQGPGGRMPVSPYLETSVAGIFAIGDQCAFLDRNGQALPPRAMYACQMGDQVASIIAARLRGRDTRPFRPMDQGELTSLGRFDGAGYVVAGGRRIIVTGKAAAAMKYASLQAHLFSLMAGIRQPVMPEASLAAAIVERFRN